MLESPSSRYGRGKLVERLSRWRHKIRRKWEWHHSSRYRNDMSICLSSFRRREVKAWLRLCNTSEMCWSRRSFWTWRPYKSCHRVFDSASEAVRLPEIGLQWSSKHYIETLSAESAVSSWLIDLLPDWMGMEKKDRIFWMSKFRTSEQMLGTTIQPLYWYLR